MGFLLEGDPGAIREKEKRRGIPTGGTGTRGLFSSTRLHFGAGTMPTRALRHQYTLGMGAQSWVDRLFSFGSLNLNFESDYSGCQISKWRLWLHDTTGPCLISFALPILIDDLSLWKQRERNDAIVILFCILIEW